MLCEALSWVDFKYSTVSTGATKRPGWDLKGKIGDMEAKVNNYQGRLKGVSAENENLRGAVTQAQEAAAKQEKEISSLKLQLK